MRQILSTARWAAVATAVLLAPVPVTAASAAPLCDLGGGASSAGLSADANAHALTLTWEGEAGATLRARFGVRDGQPLIGELAVHEKNGQWVELARDATPDFQVTTGKRRLSTAQLRLMKQFQKDSPQQIEARKWDTFWDDPLVVPGGGTNSTDLPRKPDEVRHARVAFHTVSCKVVKEGNRISVIFDGLSLGIFSGDLQFTVYKGSNLLRQEAVASTGEPSVAFIYRAGLTGLPIRGNTRLTWRDTARQPQKYEFGGAVNADPVDLRARNRLAVLNAGAGALAVFPPPHKFFFARENEVNLGYVYYRKDSNASFSLGVGQPERSEGYHPWGVSDDVWKRRTATSHSEWENFALYNAPPGTRQHMAVYYYLSVCPGTSQWIA